MFTGRLIVKRYGSDDSFSFSATTAAEGGGISEVTTFTELIALPKLKGTPPV